MLRFFVILTLSIATVPSALSAQQICDDRGQLADYLSGRIAGPPGAEVARLWARDEVPNDVVPEAVSALSAAIERFEDQTLPSARQAAEWMAGPWEGWVAKLMTKEDFVAGFVAEAERRTDTAGEWGAVLQAAQAMLNRLDDLNGAAGTRQSPEDPARMWYWDAHLRAPGAIDPVKTLIALPEGEWLWSGYVMNRQTALACAFDRPTEADALAATLDYAAFAEPEVIRSLASGRKLRLGFGAMSYLNGFLETYLVDCDWDGDAQGLDSVTRFSIASTQLFASTAFSNVFDFGGVVSDSVEFATNVNSGKRDSAELLRQAGCGAPVLASFNVGLVRTVAIEATSASGSLFVQTCARDGLSFQQCRCLAELGRGVAPRIADMGYDRRTTIKWIVESNPILGAQIGVLCGIGAY